MRLHPTKVTTVYVTVATWPDGKFITRAYGTRIGSKFATSETKASYPEAYVQTHIIEQALPKEVKS